MKTKRERFEKRFFRIFTEAGYAPIQILSVTPEELVEIPGITVPNIRAVLYLQDQLLKKTTHARSKRRTEALLNEVNRQRGATG